MPCRDVAHRRIMPPSFFLFCLSEGRFPDSFFWVLVSVLGLALLLAVSFPRGGKTSIYYLGRWSLVGRPDFFRGSAFPRCLRSVFVAVTKNLACFFPDFINEVPRNPIVRPRGSISRLIFCSILPESLCRGPSPELNLVNSVFLYGGQYFPLCLRPSFFLVELEWIPCMCKH